MLDFLKKTNKAIAVITLIILHVWCRLPLTVITSLQFWMNYIALVTSTQTMPIQNFSDCFQLGYIQKLNYINYSKTT